MSQRWDSFIKPPHTHTARLGEDLKERLGRRVVWCCPLDMTWLWHMQVSISYNYLHKVKPVNYFSMEEEGAPETSTPSWGALGTWPMMKEGDLLFFGWGWPLVGCPCPSGWPNSHAHMESSNWIQWDVHFKKERNVESGGSCEGSFRRVLMAGRWLRSR